MPEEDPRVGQPAGLGGEHVVAPLRYQHLAADDARVRNPADERDRDVDAARPRTEHEDERDDQDVERKRDDDVDEPVGERIDPAAEVACDEADRGPEHEREQDRQERDA